MESVQRRNKIKLGTTYYMDNELHMVLVCAWQNSEWHKWFYTINIVIEN